MWICVKCAEEVEDSFEICWNCGTSQDGQFEVPLIRDVESTVVSNRDSLRWYQFRLRTLLIFVTLFACVCSGFTVWYNTTFFRSPWQSPKMLKVKAEYESLCRWRNREQIEKLLIEQISIQDMHEMLADCGKLPTEEYEWNAFEWDVFFHMFWSFIQTGDRDNLVKLLSKHFPSNVNYEDTEMVIVSRGGVLVDPILVLEDAYTKCENPEMQQKIAKAIRHAFTASGIRGNDDADFVKNAFDWYKKEKNQLAFSSDYRRNHYSMHYYYYRDPMFVKKGSQPQQSEAENPPPGIIDLPKTMTNFIGMKLALIPAGEFMMGARNGENGNKDDEEPLHRVRITKPFWMGVYEVTREEYKEVMGGIPEPFRERNQWISKLPESSLKRFPVNELRWYEAAEFCNRLSKKEGLPAFYELSEEINRCHDRTVTILGGVGYRLPTEAEWEYACRAGTTTRYNYGDTFDEAKANFSEREVAVGSYPPNAFGLYDMHGNITEWCNDAYERFYYVDCPLDDPMGPLEYPDGNKNYKPRIHFNYSAVIRGSSYTEEDGTRSAYRYNFPPGDPDFGFRVVRCSSEDAKRKSTKP
jgi:formylglycine-generating enzyme required for sulfatase activity